MYIFHYFYDSIVCTSQWSREETLHEILNPKDFYFHIIQLPLRWQQSFEKQSQKNSESFVLSKLSYLLF